MKTPLTPDEIAANAKRTEEMIAKRKAVEAEEILWWKKQEKHRIEGFNIVPSDPMFAKMTKDYQDQKLEECYKEFIAVPQYDFERARAVLRKHLFNGDL